MAVTTPITLDRQRIQELIEREEQRAQRPHRRLGRDVQARRQGAERRRRLVLPAARPVADLPRARRRPEGVGRRRQRDVGLPQRLRRDGPGPRAPGDRQGAAASATRTARTSPRRPRTRSSSARSSPAAGTCRSWRYTNSGSESTMDAIRIARAYTGRETIMKIFGSYHGHHDARDGLDRRRVRQDRRPGQPRLAAPTAPASRRRSSTSPSPVPFNDAGAMERRIERLDAEGRKPACVIMEAAMMNLGIVLPEPGYLEAVREITAAPRHRPDLRRGQDRPDDRRRRRDRALGRQARHGHARQGARRRRADRRDRRLRGGLHGRRGRQRLPGRHLQREPARHGRGAREPARGDDAGGLRAPRPPQRPHPRRLHRA